MWVGAGYPALVGAIGILWFALQKSQEARMAEATARLAKAEETSRIWEQLRSVVTDRSINPRRGGGHEKTD